MTAILGLSAFDHDSAAALVVDGRVVAAAQEERFTRKKHDPAFPARAVAYCLAEAGLSPERIDHVVFYDKPLTKFERLMETYLAFAPSGLRSFFEAVPVVLREKLFLHRTIRAGLGGFQAPIAYTEHHESHAASAFFPSPYDEAAILTLDGVGEWAATTWGVGRGNRIELLEELRFPHSLGLLYSAFTYYCGFKVNSGEYKLMGLAPYGQPVYRDLILDRLCELRENGGLWLDMRYFQYCQGLTMTGRHFHDLFGGPPRPPESRIEKKHLDLAASIQAVCEEAVLRMARHVHSRTGMKNLVMAGGVALNCVANGRLLREGPFDGLWIQPAAGDAGGALGAALFVWHQLLCKPRHPAGRDTMQGSLLGPGFGPDEVRRALNAAEVPYTDYANEGELLAETARLLADGKVVGWFSGRMEFGPRSLGARSILGDARSPHMQATMNVKIKFRESFRPFAPVVLAEHAHEWFDLKPGQESPYMLLVAPVAEHRRVALDEEGRRVLAQDPDLCHRVNVVRSEVPAVTHVDHSARVQTVDADRNPRFHALMTAFHELTGCPVLVNTSFNVRGEPIVCTPADAIRCFLACDMDALVLEDCVVVKEQTGGGLDEAGRRAHLAQFQLD